MSIVSFPIGKAYWKYNYLLDLADDSNEEIALSENQIVLGLKEADVGL